MIADVHGLGYILDCLQPTGWYIFRFPTTKTRDTYFTFAAFYSFHDTTSSAYPYVASSTSWEGQKTRHLMVDEFSLHAKSDPTNEVLQA